MTLWRAADIALLDGPAKDTVSQLQAAALDRGLVLLDYTTNGDVTDLSQPLSHAALIALYLLDQWPAAFTAATTTDTCRPMSEIPIPTASSNRVPG